MTEVLINEDQIYQAEQRAVEMGAIKHSITKGAGNLAGFVGELLVLDNIGGLLCDTYDYDIIYKEDIRADVKTKRTSVKPLPYYECSIAEYNTHQDCDEYIFVRVLNDMSKGWILGWIPKDEYFAKCSFKKKGELDPRNNYTVRADCFNLPISELRSF